VTEFKAKIGRFDFPRKFIYLSRFIMYKFSRAKTKTSWVCFTGWFL